MTIESQSADKNIWPFVSSLGQQGASRAVIKQMLLDDGVPEDKIDETIARFATMRRGEIRKDITIGSAALFVGFALLVAGIPLGPGARLHAFSLAPFLAGAIYLARGLGGLRRYRKFKGRGR